jgi:uncharacterized protein YjbI with pentapeptide repeats
MYLLELLNGKKISESFVLDHSDQADYFDSRNVKFPIIRNLTLLHVDLTGSGGLINKHGALEGINTINCYFYDVLFKKCKNLECIRGVFVNCDFTGSSAHGSQMVGLFVNCKFHKVNFRRSSFCGNFVNCEFSDSNLCLNAFGGSYENCIFKNNKVDSFMKNMGYEEITGRPVDFMITLNGKLNIGNSVQFHRERLLYPIKRQA